MLAAVVLCVAVWGQRFSPTPRHARYWLATSDEERLESLKSLGAVDDPATRSVFGDAALSASFIASRHARDWFYERFSAKVPGTWDCIVWWRTWNGRTCGYRTRGSRTGNGTLSELSTFIKEGVEIGGHRRNILFCP